MFRFCLLFALCALAACTSPRENCEFAAKQDLRAIDTLMFELDHSLRRGYAVEHGVSGAVIVADCTLSDGDVRGGPVGSCAGTVQTVERPRAILPQAERRKLEALRAKRARLLRPTAEAVLRCRQRFPNG